MHQELKHAPIIPITETVIFPGISNRIFVNEVIGQNIKQLIIENNTLAIGLTTKNYHAYDLLNDESFYPVGVLMNFETIQKSDKGYIIEIDTLNRVRVSNIVNDGESLSGDYYDLEDIKDVDEREQQEMLDYIKGIMAEIGRNFKGADYFVRLLDDVQSVQQIIGYTVPMMGIPISSKQALLEMDSEKERSLKFIDYIIREKDSVHLQLEISRKYTKQKDKAYREAILREQLKNIKEELGESDVYEEEEEDYRSKVEAADLPENVRKVAMKELKKLEAAAQGSAEVNVIQNYLDLLLELPWHTEAEDIDIQRAKAVLDANHYGIDDVKKRIVEHLAVLKLKKDKQGSILLLVGPPGTGKTSLGRSVAEALNRAYVRASLGGVRDESEIRGHRRTYVGAMPGRIIKGIDEAGTMNPVFILDEIDKLGISNQGDPSAALLEVLDPEQNNAFADHYLEVPYDLSNVFFIATANDLSTIPGPLLDRAEIIELSSYTNREKFHIAREHLIPKVLGDHGLTEDQFEVTDEALRQIIENYTAEAGVRGLTKQLAKAARVAAERIVLEECDKLTVTPENLKEVLGNKTRRHEKVGKKNAPGVVTGMAWTAVGGEILFTEATFMPGSGKLILTGQLGDVMKESATIAMSLIRSRLGEDSKGFDFFAYDTHIHVPSGATPKDGPSAGVTLTTALASLVLGKPVDSELSMTGEITLSGKVMPVGGIKEKVIAAHRSGIKRVILPKENERDLEDVPQEVKDELQFIFVDNVDDVLKAALDVSLPEYDLHFDLVFNDPHRDKSLPEMIL
ncbi:MAG: endopeptidase La [Eubacterium sp.]|nr:endopeptidase La [Eubacterium sp.]